MENSYFISSVAIAAANIDEALTTSIFSKKSDGKVTLFTSCSYAKWQNNVCSIYFYR